MNSLCTHTHTPLIGISTLSISTLRRVCVCVRFCALYICCHRVSAWVCLCLCARCWLCVNIRVVDGWMRQHYENPVMRGWNKTLWKQFYYINEQDSVCAGLREYWRCIGILAQNFGGAWMTVISNYMGLSNVHGSTFMTLFFLFYLSVSVCIVN